MYTSVDVVMFFGAILVTTLLMRLWTGKRKHLNSRPYPPSLPSLPLVGSLPFMLGFDKLEQYFVKVAEKLGPIFTLKFGNRLYLILTNREVIEEALVNHSFAFSGRTSFYMDGAVNKKAKGIASRDFSPEFKRYHQLSMSILKEFGFGMNSLMESRILAELEALKTFIREKNGKKFDPREMTSQFSYNIMMNILLEKREDYDNGLPEIPRRIMEAALGASPVIDLAANILRFIPYFREKLNDVICNLRAVNEKLVEEIERIKEDVGIDCFVSRYLAKTGIDCDQEQLLYTVRDLIGAGSETTGSTLLWLIVFTANHPVLQERLQREIDSVIPRDRLPSLDDQSKLPSIEATVLEVMRLKTVVPLALAHLTLKDTEVSEYFIPKGTVMIPVIYGAHMDPRTWTDPDVFRPERFLDENNQVIKKDRVIPFSLGRRSCFGEVLARQEIFLFFTWLLQHFNILPPLNQQRIADRAIGEILQKPAPFEIRLEPREKSV